MRAGLVGDDVGLEAHGQQRGQHVGGVGPQADAERAPLRLRLPAARDGVVEVVGDLVEVPGLEAALDPLAVDLDAQRHAAVHRHGERLRAAHAAEAGRQRDRAGERAAEAAARDLGEALVGALHDALAADVDPRARRHLAVHRQPEFLEAAELVPGGPLGHQVGVGDEHARRPLVRAEDARPACPTGRAASRRRPASAGCARSRRRPPTSARRGRCRRRRRGPRAARPPRGRGCS